MQKISADPKRNRDMEEDKAVDGECPSTAFCFEFSHKPHPGKCMISEFQRQMPKSNAETDTMGAGNAFAECKSGRRG